MNTQRRREFQTENARDDQRPAACQHPADESHRLAQDIESDRDAQAMVGGAVATGSGHERGTDS